MRIIGAEEAQAVIEAGAAAHRLGDSEPRFGDVPARPDPTTRTEASFPRSDRTSTSAPASASADEPTAEHPGLLDEIAAATGGGVRSSEIGEPDPDAEPAGDADATAAVEVAAPAPEGLPHWSEPATGEVPVILGEGGDLPEPAESPTGLRFRSGSSDWGADEDDPFASLAAEPDDDDVTLAGLSSAPEDDDVAFDREVAARRVRSAPTARPRPPRPAPGAEELDLGPDRPDTLVRVVTGLGIAALALLCLSAGAAATMVLATAIVGLCAFEFFQALHQRGFRPATVIGLLGTLTIVPLAYHRGEFAFPFTLALVMVFTLLWFVFEVVHTRPMVNVAVTVGGFVYTGVLGAFAGLLLTSENGVGLILGVAIPVIAYDIAGFFVGSQFGKTRLAPEISPNKTVEGLIGGMAGSIVVAVLIVKQIHPWGDLAHVFALGVTVAIMAPLGDLAESMLKRDLGIKDFGALLPGHGGVLDRFDAILFCLPAVYFLARALKIG